LSPSGSGLQDSSVIHRFAAKKLIQLLQDKDENGSQKKEIIHLGCRYGLASRYTSYVAVDPKTNKPVEESWMMMKTRDIPVEIAHGWHGGNFASQMRMMRSAPPLENQRVEWQCDQRPQTPRVTRHLACLL